MDSGRTTFCQFVGRAGDIERTGTLQRLSHCDCLAELLTC
jgi:hypothetical protein